MIDLKELIFTRSLIELEKFQEVSKTSHSAQEAEARRQRFLSAYETIEQAKLENEYESWRKTHKTKFEEEGKNA